MTVNQHRSGTPDGSAKDWFAQLRGRSIFSPMFLATEAAAAAIRAVYEQRGEFAAADGGGVSLALPTMCSTGVRAPSPGWKPLRPVKRMPKVPRLRRMI